MVLSAGTGSANVGLLELLSWCAPLGEVSVEQRFRLEEEGQGEANGRQDDICPVNPQVSRKT